MACAHFLFDEAARAVIMLLENELGACAEADQEELFLDALSICGTPLAILGQMVAPAALLDLELLPEEATLEPVSPPYKYLLVCKVPPGFQQHAAIVLHVTDRPMESSHHQAVWALARV